MRSFGGPFIVVVSLVSVSVAELTSAVLPAILLQSTCVVSVQFYRSNAPPFFILFALLRTQGGGESGIGKQQLAMVYPNRVRAEHRMRGGGARNERAEKEAGGGEEERRSPPLPLALRRLASHCDGAAAATFPVAV